MGLESGCALARSFGPGSHTRQKAAIKFLVGDAASQDSAKNKSSSILTQMTVSWHQILTDCLLESSVVCLCLFFFFSTRSVFIHRVTHSMATFSPRAKANIEREGKRGQKGRLTDNNLISERASIHCCYILLIRSKTGSPAHRWARSDSYKTDKGSEVAIFEAAYNMVIFAQKYIIFKKKKP